MNYKEFAKIIKKKRIELNLTQKKMAQILYISPSKYNKIENGIHEPKFELLSSIIKILDIDIYVLIKKEKPKDLNHFD